ncbi:MAG: type II toxin-antitoxin system VapC family toxin [Desulfobacterales bacterium]|nr:type II toxin-antitoxin system VapC family toxin [Desulfobacterales bacterium]
MVKAYFLDTSAIVKKYMTEIGSYWIESITDLDLNNHIILARVSWVETLSAFSRLRRDSKIDITLLNQSIQVFKTDWETQYQIVEVEKYDIEVAGDLVQKYPLRAYDSIQLACALKIYSVFAKTAPDSFIFVSADDRLLNAGKSEGLNSENPNSHP